MWIAVGHLERAEFRAHYRDAVQEDQIADELVGEGVSQRTGRGCLHSRDAVAGALRRRSHPVDETLCEKGPSEELAAWIDPPRCGDREAGREECQYVELTLPVGLHHTCHRIDPEDHSLLISVRVLEFDDVLLVGCPTAQRRNRANGGRAIRGAAALVGEEPIEPRSHGVDTHRVVVTPVPDGRLLAIEHRSDRRFHVVGHGRCRCHLSCHRCAPCSGGRRPPATVRPLCAGCSDHARDLRVAATTCE